MQLSEGQYDIIQQVYKYIQPLSQTLFRIYISEICLQFHLDYISNAHCQKKKKKIPIILENFFGSSKFVNTYSHLSRPCLEFTFQKHVCNFTQIIYLMLTAKKKKKNPHHPREFLWCPYPHCAFPCNPCFQFYQCGLLLLHLELPLKSLEYVHMQLLNNVVLLSAVQQIKLGVQCMNITSFI